MMRWLVPRKRQILTFISLLVFAAFVLALYTALTLIENENSNDSEAAVTEASLSSSPAELGTPFELGQYYFNHDDDPAGPYDLARARAYYNEALREDPKKNPRTWYQLGRIDFLEGKFDTAIYKFKKQIEYFGEEVPNVYYMLGLTYGYRASDTGSKDDWQKAEEAFEHFIDIYRVSWAARVDLAWVYFAQGKYKEMKAPLEEALEAFPENPWVHNMYGLALMNTGEPDAARGHFEKAKEYAAELTVNDWGDAYPGNNPEDWPRGLSEFRGVIEKNLALVADPE